MPKNVGKLVDLACTKGILLYKCPKAAKSVLFDFLFTIWKRFGSWPNVAKCGQMPPKGFDFC